MNFPMLGQRPQLLAKGGRCGKRYVVQLGLGLTALTALVFWSGSREVWATLRSVTFTWFALASALYLAGQGLCAWKWACLARVLGFERPAGFYYRAYLGSMFPSVFLPTSIGGDVFRVLLLSPLGSDRLGATLSVLADRGIGALALLLIAAVATFSGPWIAALPLAKVVYAAAGILLTAFIAPFVYRPRFSPAGFQGRTFSFWERPGVLLFALALSLLFQALDCMTHWWIGLALGLELPPLFYFILCPLVSVAALSPITIQGLGERSVALVMLFSLAGVSGAQAVAYGLTWTALMLVTALVGGLVFICTAAAACRERLSNA